MKLNWETPFLGKHHCSDLPHVKTSASPKERSSQLIVYPIAVSRLSLDGERRIPYEKETCHFEEHERGVASPDRQ